MSTNIKILAILFSILFISTILTVQAQEEVKYRVEITNVITAEGGNLKTIINLSPDKQVTGVKIYLPTKFLGENYLIFGYLGGYNYTPQINHEDDVTTLYFPDVVINPNDKFSVLIYMPRYINQSKNGVYIGAFLSNILLDHKITALTTMVRLPPNTRSVKTPPGYSEFQVTPTGVKPQLYRIEKSFSVEELDELDKPNFLFINMTSTERGYASIKIMKLNINIEFTINPDATLSGEMRIEAENTGHLPWKSDDYISLFKKGNYENIKAYTELNRELSLNTTKDEYRVKLPYQVSPGNKVVILLRFDVTSVTSTSGFLNEEVSYSLKVSNITEAVIDSLSIKVEKYDGKVIYEEGYTNYTQFSKPISISGKTNIQPLDTITYYGLGYVIVFLIISGIAFTGYQIYSRSGLREIPEEAKKYFETFKKLTEEMSRFIELEDKRLEGKITERQYLKKRAEINKRITKLKKELEKGRKTMERLASEIGYLQEILEETKNIERNWNELQKLEDRFKRKLIKPEDYREKRKEIITVFKTHLTRLESKL